MKPSTPKGTRDFLPQVVQRRNYIFNTIKEVFEQYGYAPIETPAMENLETLTGKYGDEGDSLIFKIIESGDKPVQIGKRIAFSAKGIKELKIGFVNVLKSSLKDFIYELIRKEEEPSREDFSNFIKSSSRLIEPYSFLNQNEFHSLIDSISESSYQFFKERAFIDYGGEKLSFIDFMQLRVTNPRLQTIMSEDLTRQYLSKLSDELVGSDNLEKIITENQEGFALNTNTLYESLTGKALRYDLTVPFARFVVQHQNDLSFPFRRYQIQPVWRADRPQKGRYREFFQCDADVIGTDSLRCEVEFVQIFDEVFDKLNLPVQIRINNRKILSALAVYIGQENHFTELTIAIDKLDKLPLKKVLEGLAEKGFGADSIELLNEVLQITEKADSNEAILEDLEERFKDIPEGVEGIEEMRYVMSKVEALGLAKAELKLDINLARGLNYYTGAIFEVLPLTEQQVGSICGGGRYDDLTGIFGLKDMSGVGISFGADRIYDLLEAMDLFPDSELNNTELLFVNFGEKEADFCHAVLSILRKEGIRGELYPDAAKMKKQMKYANDKNIPFVALVGENEMEQKAVTLKNMRTGDQDLVPLKELLSNLRNL